MGNNKREETAYINQPLLDGLAVLKALEGSNFGPVTIQRVQQRTGLSYGKCRNALITLKQANFAAKTEQGWTIGPALLRFSERYHELAALAVAAAE